MLPVIYSASSSEFSSNGQGVLIDCLSCQVTEERNGIFEMELTYPSNGQHADKLLVDAIIKATAHKGDEGQLFRIYQIETDLNGDLKVLCQHISYQLSFIPCAPFTAANIGDALTAIRTNMQTQDDGFTFTTDKTTVANMNIKVPTSTKSVLGGMEGSLLDVYHGEYEFNNFVVKLWNARGADHNVILRYGKNITDISQESNIADTYTGIRPYYYDSDELVQLETSDKCVWCDNADSFPYKRALVLDCTADFNDLTDEYGDKRAPAPAELLSYANSYLSNHEFGVPKVTVKVEFEALWDTPEYAEIANLETVNLCDTVTVKFDELGISVKSKVIKTVYDSLLDRYVSLTVGSATANFTDSVAAMSEKTAVMIEESASRLEAAQQRATNTLLGVNGGYKVEKRNGNGQIIETLYMDTLDEGTATKIWRWNINGLGYSPNGPEGPYTLAITKDGGIVANFINTGTLDASTITVTNLYATSVQYDANTTLAQRLQSMQDQIDNNVETWSGSDVPTLNNYPASDWTTTALKITHIGDVYYVNNPSSPEDGHSYRFYQSGQTFEWVLISDSDITAALQQIDALETNLSTNYYNKSATDNLFIVNNQGVLSTVSSTYSTKTEAQGYASSAQTAAKNYTDSALTNYSTTSEVASAISQTADQIELSVAQTLTSYSTTTQMNTAIQQSAESILSSVSTTLEDYSTTNQMNSAIQQSADSITSTVSSTYATKTQAQGYANTAQTNAINSANSSTDTKLQSYSTITQLNNQIATRVATTSYNGATIASLINQAADSVQITAKHVNINGVTSINNSFKVNTDGTFVAAGGTIGRYRVTSTYLDTGSGANNAGMGGNQAFWAGNTDSNNAPFRVSYAGALVASSATITGAIYATSGSITGGTINLSATAGYSSIKLQKSGDANTYSSMTPGYLFVKNSDNGYESFIYGGAIHLTKTSTSKIKLGLTYTSVCFQNDAGQYTAIMYPDQANNMVRLATCSTSAYTRYGPLSNLGREFRAFVLIATRGKGTGAMATTLIPLNLAKECNAEAKESWAVSAQNTTYQAKCYFDFSGNYIWLSRVNAQQDCRAEVWGLR